MIILLLGTIGTSSAQVIKRPDHCLFSFVDDGTIDNEEYVIVGKAIMDMDPKLWRSYHSAIESMKMSEGSQIILKRVETGNVAVYSGHFASWPRGSLLWSHLFAACAIGYFFGRLFNTAAVATEPQE